MNSPNPACWKNLYADVSDVSNRLAGRSGHLGFVSRVGVAITEKVTWKAGLTADLQGCMRMRSRVLVVRDDVLVDAPPEQALAVIKDLNCMAQYEPKVDSLCVTPKLPTGGTYTARGRFAGLPWQGRFSYEMRPQGFHSEMIAGPPGVRVSGGFVVRSDMRDHSRIIHYEQYQLSWWLWPFAVPLRLYLKQAIKDELRALAQLIQRTAYKTRRLGTN